MKDKAIIIGAGGHARSIADILFQNNEYEIVGCIDRLFGVQDYVEGFPEIPIIGNDNMISEVYNKGVGCAIVALGNNRLRKKLYNNILSIGYKPINAISKYAHISSRAVVGQGVCVMAGASINVNARIGNNCIINTNCSIDHDCDVQDHCHIAPGVAMSGTVFVGELTQIGTGACVIDGINIGKQSFVGAGSVVVNDIPNGVLAYGVPARIIKNNEVEK